MKIGDKVLVKDDYIADLWDDGPLQLYVDLQAGMTGVIDSFPELGEICILFYKKYYVMSDESDFDLDGIFVLNPTIQQRNLTLVESHVPLLRLIKDKDN